MERLQRPEAEYAGHDAFLIPKKDFNRQYAHLYFQRLANLRPVVQANVARKHPQLKTVRLVELVEGERCAIVCSVFKDMPQKPTILKEYEDERWIQPEPVKPSYISDDDAIILEDESGRIKLAAGPNLPVASLVSGLVLAAVGQQQADGTFQVDELVYADLAAQAPAPRIAGDEYVVLASCLRVGSETGNPLPLQLLLDYVTGHVGGGADHERQSKIVRVILAGNSVRAAPAAKESAQFKESGDGMRGRRQVVAPIKELDQHLTQLVTSVPVDLMPGLDDPANYVLPQQPMHRSMFTTSARFSTFSTVSNPYQCDINGVTFLGTSGQPSNDMLHYADQTPLSILRSTLTWRHLAPTCPDTLASFPYADYDPFIITQTPHVYFAGGQKEYGTEEVTGPDGQRVRIVSVPDFHATGQVVLVNLRDLSARVLRFGVELDA